MIDFERKYNINWQSNSNLSQMDTKSLITLAYKQENYLYLKESFAKPDFKTIFPDYIKRQLGSLSDTAFNKQPFEMLELTFKAMEQLHIAYVKEDLFYLFLNNPDNRVKLSIFKKMIHLPKEEFSENFIEHIFKKTIQRQDYFNLDILRNLEETQEQFMIGTAKKGNILISALRAGTDAPNSYEVINWLLNEGIKWESNPIKNVFISFNYFINDWINNLNNNVFQNKSTETMENPIKIAYTLLDLDHIQMSNSLIFLEKTLNQSSHKNKQSDLKRFNELQQAYLNHTMNTTINSIQKLKI
jgi:hypothetical protein